MSLFCSTCRFVVEHRHGRRIEPVGMDGPGDRAEEEETILKIPDAGAGKRVPVQRVRVQAEAMGAGAELGIVRAPGENMVPEQAHEKQEEQPATGRATATAAAKQQQQQQQRKRQRQSSASHAGDRRPPRQRTHQTPSVTVALLWSRGRRRGRPPATAPPSPAATGTTDSTTATPPPPSSLSNAVRLSPSRYLAKVYVL